MPGRQLACSSGSTVPLGGKVIISTIICNYWRLFVFLTACWQLMSGWTEEAEISACKGYFPPLSDGGRLRRGGPIPHRGRQFTGNGDFLEKEWSGAVFVSVKTCKNS